MHELYYPHSNSNIDTSCAAEPFIVRYPRLSTWSPVPDHGGPAPHQAEGGDPGGGHRLRDGQ